MSGKRGVPTLIPADRRAAMVGRLCALIVLACALSASVLGSTRCVHRAKPSCDGRETI